MATATLQGLGRFFRLAFQGKLRRILLIYAVIAVNAGANLGLVWSTKHLVDQGKVIEQGLYLLLIISGLIVLMAGTDVLVRYRSLSFGEDFSARIRTRMLERLLTIQYQKMMGHHTGEMTSWLLNDVDQVKMSIIRMVNNLLRDPILALCLLGNIFYISPGMGLITVAGTVLIVLPVIKLGRITRRLNRDMLDYLGKVISFQRDALSAVKPIKLYGVERDVTGRYADLNQGLKKRFLKTSLIGNLPGSLVTGGAGLIIVAVFIYGMNQMEQGGLTVGDMVAVLSTLLLFYRPISSLSSFYHGLGAALGAAERLFMVLGYPVEDNDSRARPEFRHSLSMDGICFSYEEGAPVLDRVSFSIKKGSSTALIGPNGAGKSTLMMILLRMLNPDSGSVLLDHKPVDSLDLKAYRRLFAFVSADDPFFDNTIFNNLTLFDNSIDPQEVRQVLDSIGMLDWIMSLPQGLETRVGENGVQLSRGQRQKLSLARALVRKPSILLLDEATQSLDSRTMSELDRAACQWLGDYTLILITHNVSLLSRFDEIVVLDKGKVHERGPHEELLSLGGVYSELYELCIKNQQESRLV